MNSNKIFLQISRKLSLLYSMQFANFLSFMDMTTYLTGLA